VSGPRPGKVPCSSGRRSGRIRRCGRGWDAAAGRSRTGSPPSQGQALRGGRRPSVGVLSCFCPCDGGLEELSGVFGGPVRAASRASSAAMRISCTAMTANAASSRAVNAAIGVAQTSEVDGCGHPAFRIDAAVVVWRFFNAAPDRPPNLTTAPGRDAHTWGEQLPAGRCGKWRWGFRPNFRSRHRCSGPR
jgi:hypothetical protein